MVTGKGGVGKSTVAAALALAASKECRTLLVELGEQSYFSRIFEKPMGYKPTRVLDSLDVVLWGGEACLREFLLHYVRIQKIVDLFFDNLVMRTFVRAAPAFKELALLGKITSGLRRIGPALEYDFIVVDAFATGHFKALLNVPRGIAEIIQAGPMGEQCRNMDICIRDPKKFSALIVSLYEELPVNESLELKADLKSIFGLEAKLMFNRRMDLDGIDFEACEREAGGALDFVQYLKSIHERQLASEAKIAESGAVAQALPLSFEALERDRMVSLSEQLRSSWKSY